MNLFVQEPPRLIQNDACNLRLGDTELTGKSLLTDTSRSVTVTNLNDLVSVELLGVDAALACTVDGVLLRSASKQVLRAHTKLHVTAVTHEMPVRDWANKQQVRDAMSGHVTVRDREIPVPAFTWSARPHETRIRLGATGGLGKKPSNRCWVTERLFDASRTRTVTRHTCAAGSRFVVFGAVTERANAGYTHAVNLLNRLAAPGVFTALPGCFVPQIIPRNHLLYGVRRAA